MELLCLQNLLENVLKRTIISVCVNAYFKVVSIIGLDILMVIHAILDVKSHAYIESIWL